MYIYVYNTWLYTHISIYTYILYIYIMYDLLWVSEIPTDDHGHMANPRLGLGGQRHLSRQGVLMSRGTNSNAILHT